MAAPVRYQERGLSLWVGLALGFAGIIVTIGGIYEWNARKSGNMPAREKEPGINTSRTLAAAEQMPGEDAEVLELRRQLMDAQREIDLARLRAVQEAMKAKENEPQRPTRCIGGVRFEQFEREWRNVGRC